MSSIFSRFHHHVSVEATVAHLARQHAVPVAQLVEDITEPGRATAVDGRPLEERTPDATAGSIDIEDLPLLLFLAGGDASKAVGGEDAHLVVDEAEDVSLFELDVLGRNLRAPRSVSLAGDEGQRTDTGFAGWDRALEVLGVRGAVRCVLETSYRCPASVVRVAEAILDAPGSERSRCVATEGAAVEWQRFPSEAVAFLELAQMLRDLLEREPAASVAVLARDAATAERFATALGDLPQARCVLDGAFGFEAGIDVTTVDAVKGLEFDYVVVPDVDATSYPAEAVARRRLYVACTRAAFQLYIAELGTPSPIVPAFVRAT